MIQGEWNELDASGQCARRVERELVVDADGEVDPQGSGAPYTIPLTPHPNPRVSPEKAAGIVGVTGDTIRRTYARDPQSVPYVYKAGRRIFVSIPLVHEHLHGLAIPWTDCPVCWQVGPDPYDDELAASARALARHETIHDE